MSTIALHSTLNRPETVRDSGLAQKDHRKWHNGYQMATWTMTSRDLQRCYEAVRSAILATAWLLVKIASVWELVVSSKYCKHWMTWCEMTMYRRFHSRRGRYCAVYSHDSDVMQQRDRHSNKRRLVLVVQSTSGSGAEWSVDVVGISAARRCRQIRCHLATTKQSEPWSAVMMDSAAGCATVDHETRCRQWHGHDRRQARRHDHTVQPHRPCNGYSLRPKMIGYKQSRRA